MFDIIHNSSEYFLEIMARAVGDFIMQHVRSVCAANCTLSSCPYHSTVKAEHSAL
jgi:hypothetical protein